MDPVISVTIFSVDEKGIPWVVGCAYSCPPIRHANAWLNRQLFASVEVITGNDRRAEIDFFEEPSFRPVGARDDHGVRTSKYGHKPCGRMRGPERSHKAASLRIRSLFNDCLS